PRPSVVISNDVVAPGQNVKLTWLIEGRIEKLRRLRIDVLGTETVFIGRGKQTQKIVNEFAYVRVADQSAPVNVDGAAHVTIPNPTKATVPGGESAYRVEWAVRIREDIANWPDSDVRFPFTVAASAQ